jgi:hypothetical protein
VKKRNVTTIARRLSWRQGYVLDRIAKNENIAGAMRPTVVSLLDRDLINVRGATPAGLTRHGLRVIAELRRERRV